MRIQSDPRAKVRSLIGSCGVIRPSGLRTSAHVHVTAVYLQHDSRCKTKLLLSPKSCWLLKTVLLAAAYLGRFHASLVPFAPPTPFSRWQQQQQQQRQVPASSRCRRGAARSPAQRVQCSPMRWCIHWTCTCGLAGCSRARCRMREADTRPPPGSRHACRCRSSASPERRR